MPVMTNSDLYFPFKWQIFQLICLPRRSQKSLGSETGISSLFERMFTLKPQSGKNHIYQSSRDGGSNRRGKSVTRNLIHMLRTQMHAQTMKRTLKYRKKCFPYLPEYAVYSAA